MYYNNYIKILKTWRLHTIINYQTDTLGYLDLTFGPKWDYIPLTKSYVESFLTINLIDKSNISKISMSASELLENAVKFSKHDGIRMMIKKLKKQNEIVLVVFNYSSKNEAQMLIDRVNKMNKEDPLKYYINKMKESAVRDDGKSCLGLARINYEGEAKIEVKYFEKDEIIQIKTVFKISNK